MALNSFEESWSVNEKNDFSSLYSLKCICLG